MKCETCKAVIRKEDSIRGEICNNCSCEELHEENFVETDYQAIEKIAKGKIPEGYTKY